MTPVDREVIKEYLGDNTTEVKDSITTAKQEILAKVKEAADTGSSSGGVQTFTEDGTFTVPVGVTKILVTAAAGGQAGELPSASSRNNWAGKGGAGGDCVLRRPFNVASGKSITITVGKGGTTNNAVGGATVVGSLLTLAGGDNTRKSTNGGGFGGIGGYDTHTSGSTPIYAQKGSSGLLGLGGEICMSSYENLSMCGGGGGGSLGDGGVGAGLNGNYSMPGNDGTLGGGGGGGSLINGGGNGGKGGDGIVIIEW